MLGELAAGCASLDALAAAKRDAAARARGARRNGGDDGAPLTAAERGGALLTAREFVEHYRCLGATFDEYGDAPSDDLAFEVRE